MNPIDGTPGDDILTDTVNSETIDAGAGNDQITDSAGGSDTVLGGDGNDTIVVTRTDTGDVISADGGSGDDTITAQIGTIYSQNYGSTTLTGGDGNDHFFIDVNDPLTLDAGAGDDVVTITGQAGYYLGSSITLGAGSDTLAFEGQASGTPDTVVTDFQAGDGGDRIVFGSLVAGLIPLWNQSDNPFAAGYLTITASGADTIISYDYDGTANTYSRTPIAFLTLKNVSPGQLTAFNLGGYDPAGAAPAATTINGTPGVDHIEGTPGADTINGGDGNDVITGLAGDDILVGGAGDDTLTGGLGSDTLHGGDGNDVLSDDLGAANTLDGGAGDDRLSYILPGGPYGYNSAPSVSAQLNGGAGNDIITVKDEGAASTIAVDAGDGNDLVSFDARRGTIDLGAGDDHLVITPFEGLSYDVSITLGSGHDVVSLTAPVPYTQSYSVIPITDFATGNGGDTVDLSAFLPMAVTGWDFASNPFASHYLTLTTSGSDVVLNVDIDGAGTYYAPLELMRFENTTLADFTAANFGGYDPNGAAPVGQQLSGTVGDDTIDGGVGPDTIQGLAGNDHLTGGLGNDTLFGGDGNDVLVGGEGMDHLDGGAGDDSLTDDGYADTLLGGDGNDTLTLHRPIGTQAPGVVVTMDGGAGDDLIQFLPENAGDPPSHPYYQVALSGGDGNDTIVAYDVEGGTIDGGAGNDVITLYWDGGIPNASDVTVTLGAGQDTLMPLTVGGATVVTDFQVGNDGDVIDLRMFDSGGTINPFANGNTSLVQQGTSTLIYQGNFLMLTLQNVVAYTLTPYNLGGYASNLSAPTASDFNGDGHSDILWRNDNGQFTEWQVTGNNGHLIPNTYGNAGVGTDWHVGETFDFNGDGLSDILWRNAGTGQFTVWEGAAGGGFTQNAYADSSVDTNWQIAAVGDLNGDGKDDIIWHNAVTGAMTTWQSTGTAFDENVAVYEGIPLAYQIVGTGDFNGDGKADLLWRDQATGQFTTWTSNGAAFDTNVYTDNSVGTDWHVKAIADFDGDGKADLLWRNASSGEFTIWSSTGAGFTPNTYVDNTVGPDWQIAQTGDFNDDGKADILWRNTATGTFTLWQSNGHGFDENVAVRSDVGTDWHVQGHDYLYG